MGSDWNMSNAGEFDITDNAVERISSRAQMKAHSEVGSELQWEGRQCPAQDAHSGACVLNKTQTREQKPLAVVERAYTQAVLEHPSATLAGTFRVAGHGARDPNSYISEPPYLWLKSTY